MSKNIAIKLISIYQIVISPFLKVLVGTNASCRFEETCSQYTKRQIMEKGVVPGISKGIVRLVKCQPFYSGNLRKELA